RWVALFVVFFGSAFSSLNAQTHQERVTIEGAFQPVIRDFEKQFVKPQAPETAFPPPDTSISRLERKIGHRAELELLSPLAFRSGKRNEAYANFLMAGMGSRLSPLFLYGHNSVLNRDTRFGLMLSHRSTWTDITDYAPSDYMNNGFGLSLDHSFSEHTLKSRLYYQMDAYHYYGFRPAEFPGLLFEKQDLKQTYQNIGFEADLINTEQKIGYLNHNIGLEYNYFFNADQTKEHLTKLKADLTMYFDWFDFEGEQAIGMEVAADFYHNSDTLQSESVYLVSALPYLRLKGSFYQLKLGLHLNYQPDLKSEFWWYPVIRGNLYLLEKKLEFYAGTDGGIHRITYRDLTEENPWINAIVPLAWENKHFSFDAGMRAAITSSLDLHLGIRFEETSQSPFFLIDTLQPYRNSFTVVYDGMRHFSFLAEAAWKPAEKWQIGASLRWNQYVMDSLATAWHKPDLLFKLEAKWAALNQLEVCGGMKYRGKQKVPAYSGGAESVATLDGFADIYLGADYRFSSALTAYARFDNLLNKKYMLFENYPAYGFELSAGIKVRL
ncbi:MAG TPA: hypothetical protein PLC47_08090, partial [Bacteroidales bacterium]|nr:hypothetical protein [Bacteroidales bacterium]